IRLRAHNLFSRQTLEGTFPVEGSPGPRMLLFRTPDGLLHTLGDDYEAEYTARSVLCEKTRPETTVVTDLNPAGRTLDEILASLDTALNHQFFGLIIPDEEVPLPESPGAFSPVTRSGTSLRLGFASAEDLARLGRIRMKGGNLTVRTRIPLHDSSAPRILPPDQLPVLHTLGMLLPVDETPGFLSAPGDTVEPGDTLLAGSPPLFLNREREALRKKARAVEAARRVEEARILHRIDRYHARVRSDSLKESRRKELAEGGFGTRAEPARLPEPVPGETRELASLLASLESVRRRREADASASEAALARLERAALPASHPPFLLSPCRGIVGGIRMERERGRIRVTILLRKL
ncbi:MAG: hypothetical protein WB626_03765, partial [Bacteroidota bacterium]